MQKELEQSGVICVYASLEKVDATLENYRVDHDHQSAQLRPQSQVTRALARWTLEQVWSIPIDQVSFGRDQYGAVELWVAGQQWSVSFSHTKGCCAIAIAPSGLLGIDCERVQERRQRERLQRRFEHGYMQDVNSKEQFFERWTAAEAVTKAKRGALMPTLSLSMSADAPYLHWRRFQEWQLCCYSTTTDNPPQWIDFSKNNHLS
ncbi:MAG TPA: hypothetical protein VFM61_07435 [Pseudidiomarina sp.]|nr:hypothetical protein [Pseudidiomarina sp.]